MPGQQSATTQDWISQFYFVHLFKAVKQAFHPGKMSIALLGLAASALLLFVLHYFWKAAGAELTLAEAKSSPLIIQDNLSSYQGEAAENYRISPVKAFYSHTGHCLFEALEAARAGHLLGGTQDIWSRLHDQGGWQVKPTAGYYGVIAFLVALLTGWWWLLTHHWLFTILAGGLLLAIWSVAGGAICRISVLQFGRQEGCSIKTAIRFSWDRFKDFLLAPVIPIAVILVTGLALWLGGFFLGLPYIGWLGVILFPLALLGGFIITMALFGLLAGFPLMWPTIAAEGLDCTDAIARGPDYIWQRPIRAIGYGIVAVVLGGLVWYLVRLFAFVTLFSVHGFIERGFEVRTSAPAFESVLATPSLEQLYGAAENPEALTGTARQYILRPVMKFWVLLFLGGVYSYIISYFFTSGTICYFLLRHQVDETDYREVFTESPELDLITTPVPASDLPVTPPPAGNANSGGGMVQINLPPKTNNEPPPVNPN
ncbi:MAG: hypothetical protein HJJLKODD_00162 [Phycisphaerae bacterium]|nr:hypothetical protein [Phycisphaerae bacterium]